MARLVSFKMLLLLALILSCCACAVQQETIDPEAWKEFMGTVDEPRQYAMRRKASEVPLLIKALESKSNVVRFNAAQDLKNMAPKGRLAAPALIRSFEDKNSKTAKVALIAVQRMKAPAEEVLPALIESLGRKHTRGCSYSLQILSEMGPAFSEMGPAAEPAVSAIALLLDHPVRSVQYRAAWTLVKLDSSVRRNDVVEVMSDSLRRGDAYEQERSLRLLAKIGKQDVVAAYRARQAKLSQRAQDEAKLRESSLSAGKRQRGVSNVVAFRAARKVRQIHAREHIELRNPGVVEKWKWQIPFLSDMLEQGNVKERWMTVQTLRTMAYYLDDAIPPLIEAVSDPEPKVRASAIGTLGELRVEEAVDKISRALQDPEISEVAAAALRKIGTPQALEAAKGFGEEGEFSLEENTKVASRHMIDQKAPPRLSSGQAFGLCRIVLKKEGLQGNELADMIEQCVQEAGARY